MPPKLAKLFLTLVTEKTILFMFLFILKKIKEVIPTVAGFKKHIFFIFLLLLIS